MAHSRLLVGAVLLVVLLSGCSGGPGGAEEPLRTSAEPATLDPGTVADLGLEPGQANTAWVNTTLFVSIQGDVELSTEREVHARIRSHSYRSGPVVVAVSATPTVTLLEDTAPTVRDPTGSWNLTRRLESVQSLYEIGSVSRGAERSGHLLGNETTINTLSGRGTTAGETVELTGTISTTRHGGDLVTVVILGPAGTERPPTQAVLSGVAHAEK